MNYPKYVVHPGYVISINDGDRHFISFFMLCRLYHVDHRECIDADNKTQMAFRTKKSLAKFIHLYPLTDGDYESFIRPEEK